MPIGQSIAQEMQTRSKLLPPPQDRNDGPGTGTSFLGRLRLIGIDATAHNLSPKIGLIQE